MTRTLSRIVERVAMTAERVDRERGILRGAAIVGSFTSANRRRYARGVFREAKRLYEGRSIYANHAQSGDRDIADKLGWWENVDLSPTGLPRGDAHLLKSHPLFERVMEIAVRNPRLLGFSHVCHAETSRAPDGFEVVEEITQVESVDLVCDPATTTGLWTESIRRTRPSAVERFVDLLLSPEFIEETNRRQAREQFEMWKYGPPREPHG